MGKSDNVLNSSKNQPLRGGLPNAAILTPSIILTLQKQGKSSVASPPLLGDAKSIPNLCCTSCFENGVKLSLCDLSLPLGSQASYISQSRPLPEENTLGSSPLPVQIFVAHRIESSCQPSLPKSQSSVAQTGYKSDLTRKSYDKYIPSPPLPDKKSLN
jgi:hypothetical protein